MAPAMRWLRVLLIAVGCMGMIAPLGCRKETTKKTTIEVKGPKKERKITVETKTKENEDDHEHDH